jgi:uncharacterized protein (TIGR02444 family)
VDFPASPFWDFSLALYGTNGVPPACLRLQERHGVDVNLLFFCIWHGLVHGPIDPTQLNERHAAVAEWHETVVRHLRSLRRRLKEPVGPVDDGLAQALRAQIQKIEIDAEHIEQLTLAADTAAPGGPAPGKAGSDAAAANAAAYFSLLCADLNVDDHADVDLLLATAAATT